MMEITNKSKCYGCTACFNQCPRNAIKMVEDERGFKYPKIDNDKCINCRLCKKICPANSQVDKNEENNIIVYAAKHKDEIIRENSTSGGLFSAISEYVLKNNGIIYATILDENYEVKYTRADNKCDRDKMRGSKYVQSDLLNCFCLIENDLHDNKLVLFVGNPCYVAGLKSFLKYKEYNNLILCDIVCHGVPSPKIFREHINLINSKGKIKKYIFRDKKIGWRGTNVTIEYGNKIETNTAFSDIFCDLYFDGYISRDCCSKCKFTSIIREADITIGDFWGIEKYHKNINDEKGINLVILNTQKGIELFDKISSDLNYEVSSINNCLQPQLMYPSKENKKKKYFWKDYKKRGFLYVAKKYTKYGIKNKIIIATKKLIPNSIKEKIKGLK